MTQKNGYTGILVLCLAFAGYMVLNHKPASLANDDEDAETTVSAPAEQRSPAADNLVSAASSSAMKISPTVQPTNTTDQKVKILDDIFASKNDNDPRLDSEFKNLSAEDRQQLERKYAEQPKEKLNERGTLVFLLGREINNSRDMAFLRSVASETPCMDFNNCSRLSEGARDEHENIDDVTLAYPQVVALKSIGNFLNGGSHDQQMVKMAQEILGDATRSKNDVVRNMALNILNQKSDN